MGYLTFNEFQIKTGINSEILKKLKIYLKLIKIYQKKFNIISNKSFDSIWERHFLDSYQIIKLIGNKKKNIGYRKWSRFSSNCLCYLYPKQFSSN